MRWKIVTGLALGASVLLAACGGGGGGTASPATPTASKSDHGAGAVHLASTSLGTVLVDANGRTLYAFTNDVNGTSSCTGTCAQNWPALTVSPGWKLGSGLMASTFHAVPRADGHRQLVAGMWPLYRFAGDSQAGDVNGQGSLGKWFVVDAAGKLVKTTPGTSSSSSSNSSSSMYGGGY